jgi:hypothetical protein
MPNILSGKKTYIVAVAMLVVGLVNMLTGDVTGWAMIAENSEIILTGLGLSGLRAAK